MSPDQPNDADILQSLQRGEASALNQIVVRWQRPLHSFAYRYCQNQADAEDLVAQALVRLYQQRHRLREDTRLSAWLFTTLTNLCHNHHRWRTRHPTVPIEPTGRSSMDPGQGGATEPSATDGPPSLAMEREEALAALQSAISQLPHDLRTTLLLHHYERLSYREIAEITGCSERGIETRLYRARQQLRESLSHLGSDAALRPT